MGNDDFWKKQSEKFNEAAKYYDTYRPSYPTKLIMELIDKAGLTKDSKVVEIGAGSGKATELFVDRGLEMTCIEPGKQLVEEGRRKFSGKRVEYFNCRFEEWENHMKNYDLVISAQAFHWVQQPLGYKKCNEILKPNKKLGVFWNYYTSNNEKVDCELGELLKEYPIMYIATESSIEDRIVTMTNEIESSGYFGKPEVLVYPWKQEYSTGEYLGFIKTGNGYLSLDDKDKLIVEEKVRRIVDNNGGRIVRPYTCVCYLAGRV